jgi:hypothetical protein
MKPAIQTERPRRRSYHFLRHVTRSRTPAAMFLDAPAMVPDFDSACWIDTTGHGAVGIRSIADHRGEPDE